MLRVAFPWLLMTALVAADGDDVAAAFARAAAGQPLAVVALGGSITQSGGGWIGPWLERRFPRSQVTVHNAGMSATGSWLGLFRCGRDAEAHQPDLVLIEFTVNDGHADTAETRWSCESLVRRLKLLPKAPAIVIVEAADRRRPAGVVPPHRVIARHYGLLSVDLQVAADAACAPDRGGWNALFSDDVHPIDAGHGLYAKVLTEALEPFITRVAGDPAPLPPVLSERPLLLDGALLPVPADGVAWRRIGSVPGWWNRFFDGFTTCTTPGVVLEIPCRGQALGLLTLLDPADGVVLWSIDGASPQPLMCNPRDGYMAVPLGGQLVAGDHRLRLVVPDGGVSERGVTLGYVLCSGPASGPVPAGDPGLARAVWPSAVPDRWLVSGPYGDLAQRWPEGPTAALDELFAPEKALPGRDAPIADQWRATNGGRMMLDFTTVGGQRDRGVFYAWTCIRSDRERTIGATLNLDYWGVLWLNGREIRRVAQRSGSPADGFACDLPLRAGDNHVVVKVHAGSGGHLVALRLADTDGVAFVRPAP